MASSPPTVPNNYTASSLVISLHNCLHLWHGMPRTLLEVCSKLVLGFSTGHVGTTSLSSAASYRWPKSELPQLRIPGASASMKQSIQNELMVHFFFEPSLLEASANRSVGEEKAFVYNTYFHKMYTSAKNKHFFVRNLNRAVIWIGVIQLLLGTFCVMADGNKLQEIVLMCLHYGVFSNFIKLLYAGGMIVNLVM